MFGYVRPDMKELKVKEAELYKATYCGLCETISKRYPLFIRLSLSYDFVLFILLRILLEKEEVSFAKKRCIAHPLRKKPMMKTNKTLSLASDAGVIMLYYDCKDKMHDRDGIKSFIARLYYPFVRQSYKKAIKDELAKKLSESVFRLLKDLEEDEKNNICSVDQPAEKFGLILKNIMEFGLDDEKNKKISGYIGLNVGKWIYISDALDDLEKDEKKQNFNPFLSVYRSSEEAKTHLESIRTALDRYAFEAKNALGLQNGGDGGIYNILDNIFTYGMISQHDRIIKEKTDERSI